jgi:hypothetical protein
VGITCCNSLILEGLFLDRLCEFLIASLLTSARLT